MESKHEKQYMKTSFWENDHLSDLGVSLFVDGMSLNREEEISPELRDHVENCHECKSEIMSVYDLTKDQPPIDEGLHPFFDRKANVAKIPSPQPAGMNWQWMYRMAATIVITISLGLAVYFAKSNLQNDQIYSENFIPSPNLETLVNEPVRAFDVTVLSPKNGEKYTAKMRFEWKTDFSGELFLKILNNREKLVYEAASIKSPVILDEKLPPGLYYWKLETEDDLLYVGKFYSGRL